MGAARGRATGRGGPSRSALGVVLLLGAGLLLTLVGGEDAPEDPAPAEAPREAGTSTERPGAHGDGAPGARASDAATGTPDDAPPGATGRAGAAGSPVAEGPSGTEAAPGSGAVVPLRGREVVVTVVDRDGAPVHDARLTVWRSELDLSDRDEPWRLDRGPDDVASTDRRGVARLGLPSPGAVVCAGHPDHGASAVTAARDAWASGRLRLELLPVCRLRGRVVWDDGRVAAGVTVRFAGAHGDGPASPVLRSFWEWATSEGDVLAPPPRGPEAAGDRPPAPTGPWFPAPRETDGDGRFEVVVHGREALAVAARSPLATRGARATVEPRPGEAVEVSLVLPAGFGLRGRVVGPDGRPVPRAQVHAFDGEQSRTRRTDSDGRFELALPAGGSWAVGAWDGDRVPAELPEVVLDEARPQAELRLPLVRGRLIAGRLVGGDGEPRPWSAVSAEPAEPGLSAARRRLLAPLPTTTDRFGAFALGPVAPGWVFDLEYVGQGGPGRLPGLRAGGEPLRVVDATGSAAQGDDGTPAAAGEPP